MATLQLETQKTVQKDIDIVSFVNSEAAWKELLIELVDKHQLDPWNIDIVEIVDKYIDTVKKLKVMDLRVPANIILAAALLIRLKSNLLTIEEPEPEIVDGIAVERPNVTVEELNFRLRLPPKRKVSLNELIEALDDAIKMKEVRLTTVRQPIEIPIHLNSTDIEKEVEILYGHVKKHVGKDKMTTFNNLASLVKFDDPLLQLFIPLLFLAHKERVTLIQEKFFGEIVILLNS